jgi:hypothetical protein
MVVDLSVDNENHGTIFVEEGLSSVLKIDDSETLMSKDVLSLDMNA